jgi:hypothetical protein
MPTVLRIGPYRFFFVSQDMPEPAHIHVQRDVMVAKFWLDPLALEKVGGFKTHELGKIARLVEENQVFLLEQWNEHFSH